MSTETEALRAEIARQRDELTENTAALREHVDEITDWKHWVDERPLAALGAALFVGFLIGLRG